MRTEKELMDITEEMEKEIEKKYRDLIEQEKPNLWNRIETGIDSIETAEAEGSNKIESEEKKTLEDKNSGGANRVSLLFRKVKDFILKGSPVREAALLTCCCFLTVGVFGGKYLNQNVNQKVNHTTPILYENGKEAAMNMVMDNAVDYEAAEVPYSEEVQFSASSESMAEEPMEVQNTGRKLIRTIDLNIQTLKFDDLLSSIQAQVKALGGYVETSSVDGSPYFEENTRYATLTLRIPQEHTDSFLDNLSGEATITRRSENIEDITLTYVDLESHIKALQIEENTLLDLMEKAESLEDILAIQSELSNIRYQLESYQSQLKTYDNQVSYDTLTLFIEEVKEIEPAKEPNFFQRLANRFTDGIEGVFWGIQEFIITVVGAIPLIALLFGVSFIVIKIVKKIKHKK